MNRTDIAIHSNIDDTEHYHDINEHLVKGDIDISDDEEISDGRLTEDNLKSEREMMVETEIVDSQTTASDLKSPVQEVCRCLERHESIQTPVASFDPLKEFLTKMRLEIEAGRLETIFPVSGIGPSVEPKTITDVSLWMADCARRQEGLVGPRNICHFLYPQSIPSDCSSVFSV